MRKLETNKSQLTGNLKTPVTTLRSERQSAVDLSDKQDIPTECTYSDIVEWVDQNYPDRLLLHPRAMRSLKEAYLQSRGVSVKNCE